MSKNKSFCYSNLEVKNEWPPWVNEVPVPNVQGNLGIGAAPRYHLLCWIALINLLPFNLDTSGRFRISRILSKADPDCLQNQIHVHESGCPGLCSCRSLHSFPAWIWLQRLSYQPSCVPVCLLPALTRLVPGAPYLSFLRTWLWLSVLVILGIYSC